MPIVTPGKRPGLRLSKSKVFGKKGYARKHSGFAMLNLTPMVDMFTIITIYLIMNFSANGQILFMTKDIQLPMITSTMKLERAPVIAISEASISIDGSKVMDTSDLLDTDTLNVPALQERLQERRQNIEQTNAIFGQGEQFHGVIDIQADQKIKFQILKKVMFSCSSTGFSNINFAGVQHSGGSSAPAKTAMNP